MRALIYARCSTDEGRQDVEMQLERCREFCKKEGWDFDEVSEYLSTFKQTPEKLLKVMELISQRVYDVIVVFNLDRFSRQHPSKTEKMLSYITDSNCRFIAIQQNLDSNNEMMWYSFKGLWSYFAHLYSQNLSERVKIGMQKAKEKGVPIGRPIGARDKKKRCKKGYFKRRRKFSVKSPSKLG